VRRALRLIATSATRSRRLWAAAALAVVVLGIVGVARAMSGPSEPPVSAPRAPIAASVSRASDAGDDGVAATAEPSVTTSAGAPAAEAVAKDFALAWLDRTATPDEWLAGLLPSATPALMAKLQGVDPLGVPANRLTGTPAVVPRGQGYLEVSFPVDSGTLRLRMVAPEGRWLVDGVDWERA
jgi:hypothetical protein